MSARKRKFFIDTNLAVKLIESFGFQAKEMNWYQIRIRDVEKTRFFDWYHTQGTLVMNKDGINFKVENLLGDPEDLVTFINNFKN